MQVGLVLEVVVEEATAAAMVEEEEAIKCALKWSSLLTNHVP